jgi:hypothetical protein
MSKGLDDTKKEYLKILVQQYSDAWWSVRECSNAVWQIPTLLITTISVLGIAYAQPSLYQNQNARILILLLAFGFTLVSLLALIKHRFLSDRRTEDVEKIQEQLMKLLQQEEFKSLFAKQNIQFRPIKFRSADLAEGHSSIYRTSAYKWQLGLTVSVLFGIALLLAREFVLLVHA